MSKRELYTIRPQERKTSNLASGSAGKRRNDRLSEGHGEEAKDTIHSVSSATAMSSAREGNKRRSVLRG
jgi:hypothetical protein